MLAVIKTGGKQYLVKPGSKILVEKNLNSKKEGIVFFDKVLLVGDEDNLNIGMPYVENAKVEGTIIGEKRTKKVKTFKSKSKKRYLKRAGHRQTVVALEIKKIFFS